MKTVNIHADTTTVKQTHKFTIQYPNPIISGSDDWECALKTFEMFFTYCNISSSYNNNTFKYSIDGVNYVTKTIPNGLYNISDINTAIRALIKADGNNERNVNIAVYRPTFRCIITLDEGYSLDLSDGYLHEFLGFDADIIIGDSEHIGTTIPDVSRGVTSVNVCCDAVADSYNNNISSNILYSFVPVEDTGNLLAREPTNLIYLPVSCKRVDHLSIWIQDQRGNALDLQNQPVSLSLIFRKVGEN